MVDRVGQHFGSYRLIKLLGEGGFAQVYLGEHIHLKTFAAIKVLLARIAAKDVEDFRTEARTIANLDHPNIVRVLDFGVEGDIPFLVMNYAPHGSLRERLPKGTLAPLEHILPFIKQVADALQYAHDEHLIHRDVKPENMLLGKRNEVLLSDFGISVVARTSVQQEVAGTAPYMAPEQIHGRPRIASDQYSLGIVVYEWLTGGPPFHGSFVEVCGQHLLAPPPPLHIKVPTIPPLVEQIVLTALAKEPEHRFGSIKAFAHALEQANQPGTTATATPYSIPSTQVCQHCGTLLPIGGQFCSYCGQQNTPTSNRSIQQGLQLPVTPQHSTTRSYTPSLPRGQQPGDTLTPPSSTAPFNTSSAHQEFFFPPPIQKRNSKLGATILIVLLVLATIGSAVYVYLANQSPCKGLTTCTTTPPPSSATACNPTPTLQPLFIDCFTDNRRSWNTSSTDTSKYSITISNGSLILAENDNRTLSELLPAAPLANFKLIVDATLSQGSQGNGYGVSLRASNRQGVLVTYYGFELYGDGTYAVHKGIGRPNSLSDYTTLVPPTPNPSIRTQGNINHITIIANGPTMTLTINGQQVYQFSDSSYTTGSVALFVANLPGLSPGAQATFKNLVVYST